MDNQRLEQLEKRMQRMEDIEALKSLKYEYGLICDDHYNPDRIVQLFTDDGIWDGGEAVGVHQGHDAIRQLFINIANMIEFAVHYFLQPVIEIEENGNTAVGRWHLWQPSTLKGGSAVWLAGIEYDEYRKVKGKWLISKTKLDVLFMTPFEEGWQKLKMMELP